MRNKEYKVYIALLLATFGLVLGCKNDDAKKKAMDASSPPPLVPRIFPAFDRTGFENKVPDLLSYASAAAPSALRLADNPTTNPRPKAVALPKAIFAQGPQREIADQTCEPGTAWQAEEGPLQLRLLAKESSSYPICGIETLDLQLKDLKSNLVPDGAPHSLYGNYYIYRADVQDGDLNYNSLKLLRPDQTTLNIVWSDRPQKLVLFASTAEDASNNRYMIYLEGLQKGDDLYLSIAVSMGKNLYNQSEAFWAQAAYNSTSGAYRLIEARAASEKGANRTQSIVVRGNLQKQIAGALLMAVQGEDAPSFSKGVLFGSFAASDAQPYQALTQDINETTLNVFDPARFSNSDQSLKTPAELGGAVFDRFLSLKVPELEGSFYH